ncbi:SMI1/KNR4 family protein [Streptomyces longisporoflavus]|uniref:SMI1/KNR4 family protein n=1 Tax=Streptomyces longisporoflavus TaxID=28044 RepID=A0ABW7QJU8_9ACTN
MDRLSYSAAWLSQWRAEITDAVDAMAATFEETYGFPAGDNEVRLADEDDSRAVRAYAREMPGADDLLTFYQSIGEVLLPDVGNGFFLHSARDVLRRVEEEGHVFLPMADDPHGTVIGSNGGGILFVADRGGVIHRSRTASTDGGEFDRIADTLPDFLDLIRRSVVRFVETGEPGCL